MTRAPIPDGRGVSRRIVLRSSAALSAIGPLGATAARADDRRSVAAENRTAGDDGWAPRAAPSSRPDEIDHTVEGYTGSTSVAPGGSIEFHVSTDPAERYRIDVYRLGWYDGAGGRLVRALPGPDGDTQGTARAIPAPDPETGRVACDWPATDTLAVPEDWLSGLYLARFVLTDGPDEGASTSHPFVVRPHPDRRASALVQLPFATEQAYNAWGGKGLYGFASEGDPADVVSHDRPFGNEPTWHLAAAVQLLRFLESRGYDVAYACDHDVHRAPERLREYELAVSAGHDEYWSRPQRTGFEAARDAGTNLCFFGANIAYWQVRYEDDGRSIVCYKHTVDDDPVQDESRTGLFRDVGLPECELLGVQGWGGGLYNFPDYEVQDGAVDHPWMDGTGFEAGDEVVGVVGAEWDWIRDDCDVPGELTNFFHYEEGTSDLEIEHPGDADAVAYTAPSGATVFSAGTIAFTRQLDPDPDWRLGWPYSRAKEIKPAIAEADPRLQRFAENLLDDLSGVDGGPATEARTGATATRTATAADEPDTDGDPTAVGADDGQRGPGLLGAIGSLAAAGYVLVRRDRRDE